MNNVLGKRADRASGRIRTRARRVLYLHLLITPQYLVTMPSQIEGRVSLALQAYTTHQIASLRSAATTYDVPYTTLHRRHAGVLSRADTPARSRKLTNDEEQILLRKILQLSADGFPPQRSIVEEMANTMLGTKNPASPLKVGTKWVANFVKRHPELSSVYNRKFDIQRAEVEDPKLISL